MADHFLLGLFHEATPTADALDRLRKLGVPDNKIAILSGVPYKADVLGRKAVYERLVPIALIGAIGGLIVALFLMVGTPLLYPIYVGGQPLIPIPPTLIIVFELTMLGTMIATFGGLLAESRYPYFGKEVYDIRITEGHIGVLAEMDESLLDDAQRILEEFGAHHLKRLPVTHLPRRRPWARMAIVLGILFVPTLIVLLLAYAVLSLPLPDQMVDQDSIAYEMGPRLAAPAESVPIQGPSLIAGQSPIEAVPATSDSLQRGAFYYSITCQVCHGAQAKGNGNLAGYFKPPPADLTSGAAKSLSDNDIYVIITEGRGSMPSYHENLMPVDRWDVINFVRSLQK